MKKSISAILVAALMLFAFTACEQQFLHSLHVSSSPSIGLRRLLESQL